MDKEYIKLLEKAKKDAQRVRELAKRWSLPKCVNSLSIEVVIDGGVEMSHSKWDRDFSDCTHDILIRASWVILDDSFGYLYNNQHYKDYKVRGLERAPSQYYRCVGIYESEDFGAEEFAEYVFSCVSRGN